MAELKYRPVSHDHGAFLAKARLGKGFSAEYEALDLEYQVTSQMLKARSRAGLTQDVVAERMGTTKSALSRLESSRKHTPCLATLKRYASAVGCNLQVKLVPQKSAGRRTGHSTRPPAAPVNFDVKRHKAVRQYVR